MKIVETDNFGGDYPDEKFVNNIPSFLHEDTCQIIADIINNAIGKNYNRFWKVVDNDYKLKPGFEP